MNLSSLAGHTVELLDSVVKSTLPSDRVIQDFFRGRRYLGSHDRRWISDKIYDIIRNFLLLRTLSERCAASVSPLLVFLTHEIIRDRMNAGQLESAYPALIESYRMSGEKTDLAAWELCINAGYDDVAKTRREDPLFYSFPDFFPALLPESVRDEAIPVMTALNHEAGVCIRVDIKKMAREEVALKFIAEGNPAGETQYSPLGLILSKRLNLNSDNLYRAGVIEVQEEASQLVGLLVSPQKGETIVDACAGAGGKSLEIAAIAGGECGIFALDVDEVRLRNLVARASRNGYTNIFPIRVKEDDLGEAGKLIGDVDKVIVDAPCSGSGTIRRNPDKKFRLTKESVAGYARHQMEILEQYSKLVKVGGILVYSTCSIFADENISVVESFLESSGEFRRENAADYLPGKQFDQLVEDGFLATYPHRHNMDGFFAAVMKRVS